MRDWFLSFDFAAFLLLLVIMIWFITEKKVPLKSHRMFFYLVSVLMLTTVLEIAVNCLDDFFEPGESLLFRCVIVEYSIVLSLIPSVFAYYMSMVAGFDKKTRRVYQIVCRVAMVTVSIILLLNPFLKWTYMSDETGAYVEAPGVVILRLINIVMALVGISSLVKLIPHIPVSNSIVISAGLLLWVVAWFVQMAYDIQVLCFTMAVSCETLYHYLHNSGTVSDTKTHLFNRNFMGKYIDNKFSESNRFGVIVVAMDDFKFINKTYSVDIGDELLAQVGRFLKTISNHGVVFRFGSDQFCIIIDKKVSKMGDYAEEIHSRFLHPWFCDVASGVMMSASICCIYCPEEAGTYGDLVEVIDYSMAVAKKNKKGGITFASEVELDKIHKDKAVEKAVRLAMDRDELMVYYQPIFSVNHNGYNSAEALVRLKDDELGWISPEVFIPIAEKNGLIVEMGDIILEKVCKFIHDNNLKETTIEYIEVNISPIQLIQVDFADRVIGIIEKYGVEPSQINIEITETATIASMSVVNDNIGKLVDYGISFSLDDYGSGSANIDYINHMPFKIIKLDKYIIWDAFKNAKAGITLEYTIGMLNALKLLIVAEGVETEEMRDKLTDIGCHYMQGWFYSKAVSDEEFINLLNESAA